MYAQMAALIITLCAATPYCCLIAAATPYARHAAAMLAVIFAFDVDVATF